jgi:hypothetical protein
MHSSNKSNQPSFQQQEATSNAIVTELVGVRHELQELKGQLNRNKLVTSNQIAVGILKAFGVFFLLYLVFLVGITSQINGIRIGPLSPGGDSSTFNPQSPQR